MKKHSFVRTVIVLLLVFTMAFPVCAAESNVAVPFASNYIDGYNSYICDMGGGEFQIWFEVCGVGLMDEIGVLSIYLYEVNSDGTVTWIKTFQHSNYSSMLKYNDYYQCSYVSFQGSSSKTYKARVCIWAGKNGNGDTRYMWATE